MTKFTTDLSLRRLAILAAIGVVAVACTSGTQDGQRATALADRPPTMKPADAAGEEIAMSFLGAFGAFEADRAITYLADDANLSGFGVGGTREFRLLVSFFEAQGYKQVLTSCEETGNWSSGTGVRCAYDFHAIRSDEIGRGPYSGSYFDITVRDGQIVRVSNYFETAEFSPQMWEPFAEWVSTTHPKDFDVMYMGNGTNFRLTEGSIRLWEQRSHEYVEEVGRA